MNIKINNMTNLEKLYKLQDLIFDHPISTTFPRLELNEYVQTLIKIEKEYGE